MQRCLMLLGVIVVALAILPGCGGSGGGGGKSFDEQKAIALKEPVAHLRARKLIKIANGQAESQDSAGAKKTLSLAFKACDEVEEADQRATVFALLAEAQANLKFDSEAKSSCKSALESAEKIENLETKGKVLSRVARALGGVRQTDQAVAALKEAEELCAKIDDDTGRTAVLCSVAGSYDKIGQAAEADRVLAALLAAAEKMTSDGARCGTIAAVAQEQAILKRPDATKTFDTALDCAKKVADARVMTNSMADIAEKLSSVGDAKRAHAVLKEAEPLCAKIGAPDAQKQTLERIRKLQVKLPKPADE